MKRAMAVVVALVVVCGLMNPVVSGAATADSRPPVKASPPGQVSVATVNARQNRILRLKRFTALLELAKAFRFRPPAFNGGVRDAVIAPDLAVISEFRETNVEIFTNLMEEKFDEPYVLVGPTDVQAALIINTRTVELVGEVEIVEDVCMNDETSDTPRLNREYPMARLREKSTGSTFTVLGVHLSRDYSSTGISDCLVKNIRSLRSALENEVGAAFVAGDINFRSTSLPYECDPNETGEAARWWTVMTTGDPESGTRRYLDTVRAFHRERSLTMVDEWTYEHPSSVKTCDGAEGIRRSRIDYIFASDAAVAEAHADHPGWVIPENHKYSDHRFVLGRFVLSGPPRVARPVSAQQAGGVIQLTWEPVEGATEYIVYRARTEASYTEISRLTPETTSFQDPNTEHGVTYRYSVAAVGADAGQGIESPPVWQEADARGPSVTSIFPARGAENVKPDVTIRATFGEWVDESSVERKTISVYRNGNRISGRVIRKGGFVLKFDPTYPLKKGETFTIVVRPVRDVLGNAGPVFKSRFSTVEPPKKRRRRR